MDKVVYKFDCGCSIRVLNKEIKECDGLPSLEIDYENINLNCPATWELIGSGKTKGIFQLESDLGKTWCKEIKPNNIEELADIGALLRPGCLQSIIDGKSMTQHYADRKNGKEEVKYFHPSLEPVLKYTYGVLVYQESAIKIATDIAGFSLSEGDSLRKAIGKKLPELMAKVKVQFLSKCKEQQIVNNEEAETIFSWIQESQRYSFNKSHAVSYAILGYWCAYVKSHFPLHFFTVWLSYAKEKIKPKEEIQQLISDANYFDISVLGPSILYLSKGEFLLNNNEIRFGFNSIKGIGDSQITKIANKIEETEKRLVKDIKDWNWQETLLYFLPYINKTSVNNLISVGGFSHLKRDRKLMLFEYDIINQLTMNEIEFIQSNFRNTLKESLYTLYNKPRITSTRLNKIEDLIKVIEQPPYSLLDTADFITESENSIIGVPITISKIDICDNYLADSTCREVSDGKSGKISVAVEIIGVREYIVKKESSPHRGKKFCKLTVKDNTGDLSVICFWNQYEKYKNILYTNNTILIHGEKDKKSNDIIAHRITQL